MRSPRAVRSIWPILIAAVLGSCTDKAAPAEGLEGIWSTQLTMRDHPAWKVEDLLCARCPLTQYRHLQSLLADPKNDRRSLKQLDEEATRVGREYRQKIATDSQRERLARYEIPEDLAAIVTEARAAIGKPEVGAADAYDDACEARSYGEAVCPHCDEELPRRSDEDTETTPTQIRCQCCGAWVESPPAGTQPD